MIQSVTRFLTLEKSVLFQEEGSPTVGTLVTYELETKPTTNQDKEEPISIMAGASIRYEEEPVVESVLAYGSETLVPDFDICRLSYYLKCCTVGCGIDSFLNIQLIDYQHAHCLPVSMQETIVQLAFHDFNIENLLNRTFILDEQHLLLPRGTLNTFYAFKTVSAFFSVDRLAVIAGQRIQVLKIMLCTLKWMREYYIGPFVRYQQGNSLVESRAERISASNQGPEASTLQVDCAIVRASHICGPVELPRLEDDDPQGLLQNPRLERQHTPTTCDSCHGIEHQGPRYRCLQCLGIELCESCYNSGQHDQTHQFERIRLEGADPEPLLAQAEVLPTDNGFALIPDLPMAIAVPLNENSCRTRSVQTMAPLAQR